MSKRGSLSGRLSRLKKDGFAPPIKGEMQKNKTVHNHPAVLLPGWEEIYPSVWRRAVLKENILPFEFEESVLFQQIRESKNLIFYDTETTGLSTGAGTIPFLIGFGRVRESSFEIVQYFLADYPGEAQMLEALKRDFAVDSTFVSYNGKSYDSHLINSRFLLNRITYAQREELDLLYVSRRLWKTRLENCRLGTIEEQVLGIKRGPDIPGAEIPDVWFDFLKTGNTDKLKLVFSHNLQDIYSLSLLLNTVDIIYRDCPDGFKYDKYSLGKLLLFHGREGGLILLKNEYECGSREAGQFLSLHYKRGEEWDLALSIWKRLNKNGYNLFAVEEMAKYYEHKSTDYKKALSLVDKMLKSPLAPAGEKRERLIYRRERLKRKLQIS